MAADITPAPELVWRIVLSSAPGCAAGGRAVQRTVFRRYSGFPGVPNRIQDDVGDVVVGEGVLDFAGLAAGCHDAGAAQYAQVLGDQRLADAEGGHQLMHMPAPGRQFAHDAQPHRGGERLEQFAGGLKRFAGGLERLVRRRRRCHLDCGRGNPGFSREETPLHLLWDVGAMCYFQAVRKSQAGTCTTQMKPRQGMPWLRGEASGIPGL
jgi:hypothetical protein